MGKTGVVASDEISVCDVQYMCVVYDILILVILLKRSSSNCHYLQSAADVMTYIFISDGVPHMRDVTM